MIEKYRILSRFMTTNFTLERSGEILYDHHIHTPPNFLEKVIYDTGHEALSRIKSDNRIATLTSTLGFSMAACKVDRQQVIIGPFFDQSIESNALQEIIEDQAFSQQQVNALLNFLQDLPHLDNEALVDSFKLIIQFMVNKPPTVTQANSLPDSPIIRHKVEREQITNEMIQKNYDFENSLVAMIEQGNKAVLEDYIDYIKLNFQKGTIVHYTNNPMRNMTISSLTLNTICSRAALRGGLSPYHVHQLSSKYAIKAVSARSMQQLFGLIFEILTVYVNAVHDYSHHGHSTLVRHAMTYMASHLYSSFSIAEMAEALHVSSAHLSRQFKSETGLAPNRYLMELKVHEATKLLKEDLLSITAISELLHFSSPSHFTRVFRSVLSETPQTYKKSLQKK